MVDLLNLLQLHGAFAVRASRPGRAVRARDELSGMKIVFFSWKNNIQLEDGVQLGDVLEFQSEIGLEDDPFEF